MQTIARKNIVYAFFKPRESSTLLYINTVYTNMTFPV